MNKERVDLKDRLREALDLREKKPIDLVRDLKIPKSAVSQYLSGRSQNMPSERMYSICKYLRVSEPWMMGYDVPRRAQFSSVKFRPLQRSYKLFATLVLDI